MIAEEGDFMVTVSKKEVVAAAQPLQEHWLSLSNLDLLLPPVDVSVFFCYNKPVEDHQNMTFGSMVAVLKKAMAQTLVSYDALAGEVVSNSVGEPELLCNNRGVEFVEAFANVELRDLNFYNPDESIEGKLVPKKENGVLSVQATELNCGGIVVACTFDHRIADAYSINLYLVSWAEIAQCKSVSLIPSFCRSLLNPRRPLHVDPSLDDMYMILSTPPPPKEADEAGNHLISRIYYITNDRLNELQSLASSNGCNRSKLESFSAFLWKMVAQCGLASNEKVSKLGIVVDGRSRLSQGDSDELKLMGAYFGNVLSIPFGRQKINELIEQPLSWVADQVHGFLNNAVRKDHFLALIDWVEAHRPERALARIYSDGSLDGSAFVVSSGQRFPVSKVDFGWGKAGFGSYYFPWSGEAGYVMPMPSPVGNGDWVVYMHLLKEQLELIEREASNVFRPLTKDYLKLN